MKQIEFKIDLKEKDEYICDNCKDTGIVHNYKSKGIETCLRCLNAGRLNQ